MKKTEMTTRFNKVLLLCLVPIMLNACSNNPSGALSDDDIPPVPSFQSMQMDLSIFGIDDMNMEIQDMESLGHPALLRETFKGLKDLSPGESTARKMGVLDNENHGQAAMFASTAAFTLNLFALWPEIYFNEDTWGEARLVDGVITWEYTYAFEGDMVSFRVTAEELGNGDVDWQLRFSAHIEEDDISVDNALFMRAVVAADAQQGYWEIYDFEGEEEAIIRITYQNEDGVTVFVSLEIWEDEYDASGIVYEVDGTQASLIIKDYDGTVTAELVWNTDNGAGYIIADGYNNGDKACWDEKFENTDC